MQAALLDNAAPDLFVPLENYVVLIRSVFASLRKLSTSVNLSLSAVKKAIFSYSDNLIQCIEIKYNPKSSHNWKYIVIVNI